MMFFPTSRDEASMDFLAFASEMSLRKANITQSLLGHETLPLFV